MPMKTILVVDDEVHVCRIVSNKLTKHGYSVLIADSAEAALEMAQKSRVDLVITDNNMAGMSGIEMARELYRHPRHARVPVIMISARQFEIGKGELAATNIQHVEAKPFSMRGVTRHVERLIGPAELAAAATKPAALAESSG
jgi:CheY-like chemotaxis protein